jgi:hypothetical protein
MAYRPRFLSATIQQNMSAHPTSYVLLKHRKSRANTLVVHILLKQAPVRLQPHLCHLLNLLQLAQAAVLAFCHVMFKTQLV